MEALASPGRVGYFRPIVAGGEQPDNDIELIRRWYRLPQTYEESFGAVDDLSAMSDRGRYEELLKRILDAYKRLDDTTDLMLVEGSDFSEASRALEFDFNADMANHLGCLEAAGGVRSDWSVERVLEGHMQLAHGRSSAAAAPSWPRSATGRASSWSTSCASGSTRWWARSRPTSCRPRP